VRINGRTLAFEKVPESPREVWAPDGSRMSRDYVIAGDAQSRIFAAWDFLGGSELIEVETGDGPRYYVSRQTPHDYPFVTDAGDVFLFAQSIPQGRPLGVGAPNTDFPGLAADYTNYLMTVEYRTLSYDVKEDDEVLAGPALPLPDSGFNDSPLEGFPDEGYALAAAAGPDEPGASRYITRVARPGGRFHVLRAGMMGYVSDNKPVPEGIPLTVPFVTLSYTWHQVPEGGVPNAAIRKCLGTINNLTFDGYPAETLLLTNVVPRPFRNPFGERNYDVEYTFRYQPNVSYADGVTPRGHNFIPRVTAAGGLDYEEIRALKNSGGSPLAAGSPPYRLTDFATLFRPDQD
jgi:hypothetical protein